MMQSSSTTQAVRMSGSDDAVGDVAMGAGGFGTATPSYTCSQVGGELSKQMKSLSSTTRHQKPITLKRLRMQSLPLCCSVAGHLARQSCAEHNMCEFVATTIKRRLPRHSLLVRHVDTVCTSGFTMHKQLTTQVDACEMQKLMVSKEQSPLLQSWSTLHALQSSALPLVGLAVCTACSALSTLRVLSMSVCILHGKAG